MNVLHLMVDGAIAAAELLALLLMPPATSAAESTPIAARAAIERSVQLHHLSTAVDVRLLGSLADVRMAHHVRNDGSTTADLAAHLPAVDEQVASMRIVRAAHAVDLLAGGNCGDALPASGHARLSSDEAIADALRLAPGSSAIIEVIGTAPLVRSGEAYRVALPLRVDADAPRAVLVDQGDRAFLFVLPQRRASTATLVLRPASGAPRVLHLGEVDARLALLVPLAGRAQLDELADGAIELELTEGASTAWTTLVADRIDDTAVQARAVE
ncbi:MAG: hypothetical protein ACXWVT_07560 [Burkholderiaceae bacterium]